MSVNIKLFWFYEKLFFVHNIFVYDSTTVYSQPQFIANCIVEIKKELKQENVMIKANAVSKLTYVSVH